MFVSVLFSVIAPIFGLIAVGYFFLAYRGASAAERPDEVSAPNPE